MSGPPRRCGAETGFTLVEVLLAVAILGIGVVSIVGGMMTSIKVSAEGRSTAEAQQVLRAYAEAVMAAPYVGCGAQTPSTYSSASVHYDPPTDVTASVVQVDYLSSADSATAAFGACQSPDTGIQRVTLRVAAADGTTRSLKIVKRGAG